MKSHRSILKLSIIACTAWMLCGCNLFGSGQIKGTPPPDEDVARQVGVDALMVATGTPPLKYKMPKTGKVFVVDMTLKPPTLVAFGQVNTAGSTVDVNVNEKAVMLRDPTQKERTIIIGQGVDVTHTFAIYATPSAGIENMGTSFDSR